MAKYINPAKVVTGVCRFSYANLWEAKAMDENSKPKYSVSLIIPKSDTKTIEKIRAAIQAACEEGQYATAISSMLIPSLPRGYKAGRTLPGDGENARLGERAAASGRRICMQLLSKSLNCNISVKLSGDLYVCVQVFPENRCIVKGVSHTDKKHYRRYLLCTLPFIRRTAVKTQETFVTRIWLPLPQPQTSRKPLPTTTFVPSMPTAFGKRRTSSARMFSRWTATTTTPTTRATGSRRKPLPSGCQMSPLLPPTAATTCRQRASSRLALGFMYSSRPLPARTLPRTRR